MIISTSFLSTSAAAAPIPRTIAEKNGSAKTRSSGSQTTSAIASVRRVTRLRAAWFGE